MKVRVEEIINEAVFKGTLPLAFLNSQVVSSNKVDCNYVKVVNERYLQSNLPDADSSILISKIYELF